MTLRSNTTAQKQTKPSKIAIEVKDLYPPTPASDGNRQFAEMADDTDGGSD
ncbi:MAG: hypothetical protein SW833_11700 [Cyanobacteriota bacterium]|nr:hypothetical protein [Cyanobacteriota bacterium]